MNRQFLQHVTKLEKRYVPSLIRIITAFRKKFISDLKAHGLHAAMNKLNTVLIDPELTLLIQVIYRTAGIMGARMTYDEIRKLATQKAGGFGRNETWIRDVMDYLKLHHIMLARSITSTMKDDLVKILQKGIDEGWTIEQMVKVIVESKGLIEARARLIARTEVIRAANVGHSIAASSLPYEVDKKWSAAHDFRTRHSHKLIDGKIVDENGTFKVAIYKGKKFTGRYDNMHFPGDPTADPSNTCNCRCRALYIPKRDSQGNLVMRNPNQARVIPFHRTPSQQIPGIAAVLKSNIHIGIEK